MPGLLNEVNLKEITIGELVRQYPRLSRIFQQYQIDFCCGGKKPLSEAAKVANVPVEQLEHAITEALVLPTADVALNWDKLHLGDLCQHIYVEHHEYLYREMPRLKMMLDKVVTVHGEHNPTLYAVKPVFYTLTVELETHMQKEEQVLFPYCTALDTALTLPGIHCGSIRNPIIVMEREHDDAGKLLAEMRRLTGDYTPPEWACNTYRALLVGLQDMEADIHIHIHKENNILFPLALQRAAELSNGEITPHCCGSH